MRALGKKTNSPAKLTANPKMLANRKEIDLKLKRLKKEDQLRKSNEATKRYNDAKATLRSTDKRFDQGGMRGTARQWAAKTVSSMEAADPKKYKSIKGLPAPGAKATTKPATKPATKPVTKAVAKPAAKANSYDAANKGGAMDKLVKARNSAAKGSHEYAAAQNKINSAMGSKVKHTPKKIESVSSLEPTEVKKDEIVAAKLPEAAAKLPEAAAQPKADSKLRDGQLSRVDRIAESNPERAARVKARMEKRSAANSEPTSSPATMRKSSMAKMKKKC